MVTKWWQLARPAICFCFAVLFRVMVSFADEKLSTTDDESRPDLLRLTLPPKLFAVTGIECNVYFDNVILALNPANFAIDVICEKGIQQRERWTWTPTEIGEIRWDIVIRDEQNRVITRGRTMVTVSSPTPKKKRELSLLLVGDSLTHASVYSQHLLDLSSKWSGLTLTLIGSHGLEATLGPNRHEGYGGWTALRFATHDNELARQGDYTKRRSPFLYKQEDGTVKLDFQKYCADVNNGKLPDVVTIFLGPNDIFSFNDDTIDGGIETMLKHLDQLIDMIHSASPSTRLGIMLPVPPAASQDAFGSNYGSGQTRWQYKRNQHTLVEAMIRRYRDRQPHETETPAIDTQKIHLIPTHTNLDCVHNYPTESVAPNSHSDEKIMRQNNGAHPSVAGYRQIGDTVFAWLMSLDNLDIEN